jgi:ATP-dependent Lon protease
LLSRGISGQLAETIAQRDRLFNLPVELGEFAFRHDSDLSAGRAAAFPNAQDGGQLRKRKSDRQRAAYQPDAGGGFFGIQPVAGVRARRARQHAHALVMPQRAQWKSTNDFFHVAGIGLIRACVGCPDGTSNLILQGLRRVRLSAFETNAPFPVARIDPLESKATSSVETDALGAKVLELYSRFKESGRQFPARMDQYLSHLDDAEMLADLMAATFINDPLRRQQVLEELTVNQRLRLVIQYLREETGNAAA